MYRDAVQRPRRAEFQALPDEILQIPAEVRGGAEAEDDRLRIDAANLLRRALQIRQIHRRRHREIRLVENLVESNPPPVPGGHGGDIVPPVLQLRLKKTVTRLGFCGIRAGESQYSFRIHPVALPRPERNMAALFPE